MAEASPERVMPVRYVWLDYARAVGIILVVFAHVADGIRRSPGSDVPLWFGEVFDLIYTFHMPLFFAISGYLFAMRPPADARKFAMSCGVGLVWPYVLWSLIFVLLQNAFPWAANRVASLSRLYEILWNPIFHMWFLYVLFVVRLVYFLSYKIDRRFAFDLLLLASVLTFAFAPQMGGLRPEWFMGFAVFGLGALLARHRSVEAVAEGHWPLVLFGAGGAWLICAWLLRAPTHLPVMSLLAAVSGVAMCFAVSRLLPQNPGQAGRTLAFLGQASLAIYVAHTIFAAGLRAVLFKVGAHEPVIQLIAGIAVGVTVPSALFLIANRLKITPYVGFGHTLTQLYVSAHLWRGGLQPSSQR